ncbi:MAG TPA: ThuA domain-containing protein [Tepidisphaeraceae bacterium]
MQKQLNRREILKASGLAAAGFALSPLLNLRAVAQDAAAPRKKVLFFTKSQTFQHSVIARPQDKPSELAYAEKILKDLGAKHGFDVTCSKDGSVFAPEKMNAFDVFAFMTTGDLTQDSDKYFMKKGPDGKPAPDPEKLLHKEPGMPAGGKEAFLEAIKNGKGFIGFHCASDTFHSGAHVRGKVDLLRDVNEQGQDEFDPYIQMLGGEFIVHGAQQEATLLATDPKFPGASAFDKSRIKEEWYSLKNFAPDLHVILAQDCSGMRGPMYQRQPFPQTWARMHGKGRVFYTSLGHREDVWQRSEFLNLIVSALKWTTGQVDADLTPNLKRATPNAEVKRG